MLVIRSVKKENQEKTWNPATLHMCSPVFFVNCLDGIQISSLETLKEHTEAITKPLIHTPAQFYSLLELTHFELMCSF